jgi:hypothetical protein
METRRAGLLLSLASRLRPAVDGLGSGPFAAGLGAVIHAVVHSARPVGSNCSIGRMQK